MNEKASLSVVLIVKNESENIADCLASVTWSDEIVVIDAGSRDDTVRIAQGLGAKVFEYPDWQGYGPQRQIAQNKATGDWILMIDADERVSAGLKKEIKKIVMANKQDTVYEIPILPWCFGRFIRHGGWYPGYTARLYPRNNASFSDDLVHERLIFSSSTKVRRLTSDLLHYTYRDINHYLVKSASYAAHWAAQRRSAGRRASIMEGVLHGAGCFLKMYVFKAGFLDGRQGFLLAILSAHSTFVKYADLWVRCQEESQSNK